MPGPLTADHQQRMPTFAPPLLEQSSISTQQRPWFGRSSGLNESSAALTSFFITAVLTRIQYNDLATAPRDIHPVRGSSSNAECFTFPRIQAQSRSSEGTRNRAVRPHSG